MWIAPLQLTVFAYLVYVEFGWSTFIGLVFVFLVIFIQFFAAKAFAWYRYVCELTQGTSGLASFPGFPTEVFLKPPIHLATFGKHVAGKCYPKQKCTCNVVDNTLPKN